MSTVSREQRIQDCVRLAEDKFGEALVEVFPEVRSGDFPPDASWALEEALDRAVKTWLGWNYPMPKVGDRYRLSIDVDRFPHFVAKEGMTGTVTEIGEVGEYVSLRMDETIPGCEEWSNEIVWTEEGGAGAGAPYEFALSTERV